MTNIDTNGMNVSVREEGSGEPIVLLHSSACSKAQWKAAFETFRDCYHVVAPDLLEYGETGPWRGSGRLTLADEATCVKAVMSRCDGPVHLIGHSYGGAVALRTALQHADRLASLTLIEPVAFHVLQQGDAEDHGLFDEITKLARTVAGGVTAGSPLEMAKRFTDYWNGQASWSRLGTDKKLAIGERMYKVVMEFHATITEPTPLAAYSRIDVPTLILCATHSPEPVRRITRILAETLPVCRHRTVQYAGHMSPMTHPTAVNAHIAEHLRRNGVDAIRRAA